MAIAMLDGLRHHPIIGGDDQPGAIDRRDPGQHVADEALVAGHIDEADHRIRRRLPIGETDVDRDGPRLFPGQTIRLHAGQRADKAGLAVVDMAGGGDKEYGEGGRGIVRKNGNRFFASAVQPQKNIVNFTNHTHQLI